MKKYNIDRLFIEIENCRTQRKKYEETITYYSAYLKRGIYRLCYSGKPYIYRIQLRRNIFRKKSVAENKNMPLKFRLILLYRGLIGGFRFFYIKGNTSSSIGNVLFITNDDTVKIIDTKKSEMYSFYDQKTLERIHKTKSIFGSYFPLPYVAKRDNYIVEKYMDYTPRYLWDNEKTECEYFAILELYSKYIGNDSVTGKIQVNDVLNKFKRLDANVSLDYKLNFLFNEDDQKRLIPIVFSHGDLQFRNILVDENSNRLFIDWEYMRETNFMYDIFMIAIDDAFNNNYHLLDIILDPIPNDINALITKIIKGMVDLTILQMLMISIIEYILFEINDKVYRIDNQKTLRFNNFVERKINIVNELINYCLSEHFNENENTREN